MLRWLLQAGTAPTADLDWLTAAERSRLASLKVEKRRRDWLLGRYAAKRLLVRWMRERTGLPVPMSFLEIGTADSGAPEARLCATAPPVDGLPPGRRLPVALSISHSGDRALAALASLVPGAPPLSVGADVERIEPRIEAFAADYFTPEEIAETEAEPLASRDRLVTSIWSAKEAVLKALGLGLTVDTRSVSCLFSEVPGEAPPGLGPSEEGFRPFAVRVEPALLGGSSLHGFWRSSGGYVLTLAVRLGAVPAPAEPVLAMAREGGDPWKSRRGS